MPDADGFRIAEMDVDKLGRVDADNVARDVVSARSDFIKSEAENCGAHLEFTTDWMEGRE